MLLGWSKLYDHCLWLSYCELPDIPTAGQIQKEGIAVSEILTKQMQKIEELTLYLIELKKQNDELITRVAMLENKH